MRKVNFLMDIIILLVVIGAVIGGLCIAVNLYDKFTQYECDYDCEVCDMYEDMYESKNKVGK